MGTRQILLLVLFGTHWLIFVVLLIRRRTPSLLLPIGVFTLLVLTQLFWRSEARVSLGPLGGLPLRWVFRGGAILLAIPSLSLMIHRLRLRRKARTSGSVASS